MQQIKQADFGGLFYPSNKDVLDRQLDIYFSEAQTPVLEKLPFAIVVPHAGYQYSGTCASYSYKSISAFDIDSVLIVGRSHRARFPYVVTDSADGYETPFGILEADSKLRKHLLDGFNVMRSDNDIYEDEHSLEVQYPFIKKVAPKAKVVNALFGTEREETITAFEELLIKLKESGDFKNMLIVCSTDLSHYHDCEIAKRKDGLVVDAVKDMQPDALLSSFQSGAAEACAYPALISVMKAATRCSSANSEILDYRNSGDASGDYNRVVGYLSAVIS